MSKKSDKQKTTIEYCRFLFVRFLGHVLIIYDRKCLIYSILFYGVKNRLLNLILKTFGLIPLSLYY